MSSLLICNLDCGAQVRGGRLSLRPSWQSFVQSGPASCLGRAERGALGPRLSARAAWREAAGLAPPLEVAAAAPQVRAEREMRSAAAAAAAATLPRSVAGSSCFERCERPAH